MTGVQTCALPISFVNYQGTRATTADTLSPTGTACQGSILYAGTEIYTDDHDSAGVLVYVYTGDITILDLQFVGTLGRNSNPSVGIQWSSSGEGRTHEQDAPYGYTSGVSIKGCQFYTCSIAMEMFGSSGFADTLQCEGNAVTIASKDSATPKFGKIGRAHV